MSIGKFQMKYNAAVKQVVSSVGDNDSIAASNAWKNFKKGYMSRTHKFKNTPYEKPLSLEDNLKEYNAEKNEFYYDTNTGKMRLIPTDDAELKNTSGIKSWQLAPKDE